ncbi:NACHT domain-containing protein [Caryophanon latum]|uniref:NACHT domain-containing protein n=1 Tax=Caryophanon latum TaxID=33977 RepID=A0A1C0YP33_9BACL|nr:NACHT domain-containing protein [Caryophanon latum]OCS88917.1 hypothetical protein A6K76_13265 [Caryophanon latum]
MLEGVGEVLMQSGTDHLVRGLIDSVLRTNFGRVKGIFKEPNEGDEFLKDFEEYLNRMYRKSSTLNTIILHRTPTPIEKLYVPLTLSNRIERENDFYVNQDVNIFINKYKKIIITDSAGMGKSTVMKWMFRESIKEKKTIPIFIELRKINSTHTIIDEITKELNPLTIKYDEIIVKNLIDIGGFTFFLDGYDEITLKERSNVTAILQDFITKADDNNQFILSSRPESALASFSNFYSFNLLPLSDEQANDLLRKYALVDNAVEVAENLIKEIRNEANYENLATFLENPLMVTLLYKGYDYKQKIPYKKSIFYRQVFDSLFEGHDLSKGDAFSRAKESDLDIETFHTVLRTLGFITFIQGKIEFTKDEIITFLNQCKIVTQLDFNANELLNDLIKNVPIFYQEGIDYRWTHKSLQEYFVASYICIDANEKQADHLNNIYAKRLFSHYMNVMDLCYDMDYKNFKKTIIYKFLQDLYRNVSTDTNKNKRWNFYMDIALSKGKFETFNGESWELFVQSNNDSEKKLRCCQGFSGFLEYEIHIAFYTNSYFELGDFLIKKGENFIFRNNRGEFCEEELRYVDENISKDDCTKVFFLDEMVELFKQDSKLFNCVLRITNSLTYPIWVDYEKVNSLIKEIDEGDTQLNYLEI